MHDDVAVAWTEERRKALDELDQGDVLEGLPFGYYGQFTDAAATPSLNIAAEAGITTAELTGKYASSFGIITSQSCDLAEEANPPKRPWFLASPVYERPDFGDRSRFKTEIINVRYLVPLSGIRFAEGVWLADLRIQVPFDKAVLIGRPIHDGFATHDEAAAFGRRLAQLYSRPAFPSVVSSTVLEFLRDWFEKNDRRIAEIRAAGVREFRLRASGTGPYEAQLLVVVDPQIGPDGANKIMQAWYVAAVPKARARNVTLLAPECASLDFLSATKYLSYHPVALDSLTQRPPRDLPAHP